MRVSIRTTGRACALLWGAALLYGAGAQAAPLTPAERRESAQHQSDLIGQARRDREALLPLTAVTAAPPAAGTADAGPCFPLHRIHFHHSTLLDAGDRARLSAPYVGQCVQLAQINQLVHDVSNWYIERGYVTSRAFLREQDLSGGELQLEILEGRVEAITVNQATAGLTRAAFAGMEGQVLNLRDIEQGMEQMNRLPSQQVTVEIAPGREAGYSRVNLTRAVRGPVSGSVTLDNSGQRSTGVWQLSGSLVVDNVLGVADQWFVSPGHSSRFASSHDARSVQAGMTVPWGYWTLGYSYSQSHYRNIFINRDYPWDSAGRSDTHRLSLSRVVYRNARMKTALSATVSRRSSRHTLNGTVLPSGRQFSSVSLGLGHSQTLWGGLATFNPGYSRGVRWLGGETDAGREAGAPRAAFNKWTLSASYAHPLADGVGYLGSLYGQYAADRLYGVEQLTLGGESSVRGIRSQYTAGNRGLYWRNEMTWQAGQLPGLGAIGVLAALDGGQLYNHRQDTETAASLWGGAVGLTASGGALSHQVTVGWPLAYPAWLEPDRVVVSYRAGVAF
ncbi:ShlB/FhaC/HecB family hemolysin secretion/activation protein [Dickeya aquatica]|uniref:Channel-forming transporter/cytolysins activator of TpsB family n=1 Tax=Dickeya aquatica TaxID=1401087 RepID=A0A375ABA5_9GAMM|nr:ShlB/FhaC/HecB family hemolysin secretion/activation protein [Dickeya aquatica]SLM63257.1 Channel-forming transporter/cytolysins activator of TpsB family [Dickeya aquatica]